MRSAAGLAPVLKEPYLNYQAELQATKALVLQLEADQAKRSVPVRRQVKQTTSADALREGPDPHAQYVGIGKAVGGARPCSSCDSAGIRRRNHDPRSPILLPHLWRDLHRPCMAKP